MSISVGLLSDNSDIQDDFKSNFSGGEVVLFSSVDAIKKESMQILAVDGDFFDSSDSIQFFLSKIRKKVHEMPVLLVLKVSNVANLQVDWFFNDFLLYPFRKGELAARLSRLMTESGLVEDIIVIGNLKINLNEYTVYLNNQKMDLTYKEFELLRLLVQNRGDVFSRKELLNRIWGVDYIGGTRTVDVHVRRLRGKLGDDFNSIIETVRNVGYRCKE
ncbi:MAG TPA: response regulator transcription factor [Spirochaetota bacterium]|nr:response regulator transcription factor [Spirochaetota bacterium]HPR47005.1 response regulator transcription factor [Spirochaetota bacterium]